MTESAPAKRKAAKFTKRLRKKYFGLLSQGESVANALALIDFTRQGRHKHAKRNPEFVGEEEAALRLGRVENERQKVEERTATRNLLWPQMVDIALHGIPKENAEGVVVGRMRNAEWWQVTKTVAEYCDPDLRPSTRQEIRSQTEFKGDMVVHATDALDVITRRLDGYAARGGDAATTLQ
jgi:hypothetical protein